ncbi:MAG TPA: hypothetical protein VG965_01505 [Patescibacteria group bacterium]|nr:hypothetical protein [Patescibacteria group bacterium]
MPLRWEHDVEFLEYGDIYFFYKVKRNVEPHGIADVSRFFIVLDPEKENPPRYIVMGNKWLPKVFVDGNTAWGFVQIVGGRGFRTQTSRSPNIKNTSRPAGEGIYAIVTHRDHTHLLYLLELPKAQGPVQKAFNIQKEGNYIFQNRSVETSPKSPDLQFSNFSRIDVNALNKRGTEILLVGVGSDIGRLGISAQKDYETIQTADIFSKLHLDRERHPIKSLISGDWT